MARKEHKSRGFSVFIAVLTVLLILACALFVYASAVHRNEQPKRPTMQRFAMETAYHG